jgi:hypothetical protein
VSNASLLVADVALADAAAAESRVCDDDVEPDVDGDDNIADVNRSIVL